jgi:hypothetical protein
MKWEWPHFSFLVTNSLEEELCLSCSVPNGHIYHRIWHIAGTQLKVLKGSELSNIFLLQSSWQK